MFKNFDTFIPGLVSVIIPTYNRSDLVTNAIDSVLSQTYLLFEIIVVDDCSTDNTIEILSRYENKIRVIKCDNNSYVGFARNLGVSFANGEFVAFLDSDDSWLPNKLELQLAWMFSNGFNVSTTGFYSLIKNNNLLQIKNRPYIQRLNLVDILYGVYIAPGSTLIIRKEYFIAIGGYDITYRRLEDWDFLINIFIKYEYIGYFNEPLAKIYSSNDFTFNKLNKMCIKLFINNYKKLFFQKVHYPIILLVGIFFELFAANYKAKRLLPTFLYLLLFNLLSFGSHPYFKVHGIKLKNIFNHRLFVSY